MNTATQLFIFCLGIPLGFALGAVVSGKLWAQSVKQRQQQLEDLLQLVDQANANHASTLRKWQSCETLLAVYRRNNDRLREQLNDLLHILQQEGKA